MNYNYQNTIDELAMLQQLAPDLWHLPHRFKANGLQISSRMTVVRLQHGGLWLHSPVPLPDDVRAELAALGPVEFIIAPNKTHHFFLGKCKAAYPDAQVFGPPGLCVKRPDIIGLRVLRPAAEPGWGDDLDQVFIEGIPFGNETAWLHRASASLILTDLCQWWQGDIGFRAAMFARITGVRGHLAVPRSVRLLVQDRAAVQASMQRILQWRFERVIVAHNAIVEAGARAAVERAFREFTK